MSILLRENWVEMEGSIQKVLDTIKKNTVDLTSEFYNISKSNRSQENHLGTGEMGLMSEWDGQVNYDVFQKGYENNYRHKKYSTGIQIERELLDFKEFGEIKKRTNKKSYAIVKTLNHHAVQMFEQAFGSFKSADGLSLCNDSHLIIPGADAQSNTGTDDMTVDAIEDAQNAMAEFKDDRGHPMMLEGKRIICGQYWKKTAKQIVGSKNEAYTSDNQKNVQDDLTYFCTPWIKGKKWFLIDPTAMKDGGGANWYMARDPRNWEYMDDFDTEVGKYKAAGMWSNGVDSPFCVFGNNPG